MSTDLRFPIGAFTAMKENADVIAQSLADLEALPDRLADAVSGLTEQQLDTPYRPGGWTVRQVVHHLADSHMNGLTRTKLALTEEMPTIKPYDEAQWAQLADTALGIDVSLPIIRGIQTRWVTVLRSLTPQQLQRAFIHPEHLQTMTIGWQLQHYAWHSRHHVGHITALRQREGW